MNRRIGMLGGLIAGLMVATMAPASASSYTAHHPSQGVECKIVDNAIAKIPHGDGVAPVTDDEVGPGGARFNGGGRSFVTFHYDLNAAEDGYDVVAGRSNVGGNAVNDYPENLNLPQAPREGVREFTKRSAHITLSGDDAFQLPGEGNGGVRINMQDADRDGIYEGCAKRLQLTNFGFSVTEGGDFVQHEYYKAWAETDENGRVTSYEWTEISTFHNVTDGN